MESAEKKYKNLKRIISEYGNLLVAFSGGVDSTFLLKTAKDVLGENVIAVSALSETYVREELETAKKMAEKIGVKHIIIESKEVDIPQFRENPPDRCYYCKYELFSLLKKIAAENGIRYVADGTNYNDVRNDHRPGMRAAQELGVVSPLYEAKLNKEEIRYLSKNIGLETWNKPEMACLSSRFPYGTDITREKLQTIDEAERFLRGLGFKQLRVRHHGDTARIEIEQESLKRFSDDNMRISVVDKFKSLGFKYVALDLEGYRRGSMN
ncbi:MAG: ATP-dependent sacrificial sulfur transferase LarE [Candidatus Schekmanbacteria bacterium]|nr:MAG: ATP-dependent sacrificial sulfur transferase LarE [Candidatus Schekmanbacteria bacterium]